MKTIKIPTVPPESKEPFSTGELQREIQSLDDAYVCVMDDLTRVQFDTAHVAFDDYSDLDSQVAIVTVPVMTGIGKRLGYELVSSLGENGTSRRRPLRVPPPTNTQRYFDVPLPNEGWMLLRVSVATSLGLREDLGPLQALTEYAVRCLENGYRCVSDMRLSLHRTAGYAESCMANEQEFGLLRTEAEWQRLIISTVRRQDEEPVDLIFIGNRSDLEQVLSNAGYSLGRIIVDALQVEVSSESAVGFLAEALVARRNRAIAVVTLGGPSLPEGWLARLMHETRERADVGIAVLGSDGRAGRIHQLDAIATIFRPERIPLRSIPVDSETINTFLAHLRANLAGTGVGIRQTADRIPRAQSISILNFNKPQIVVPAVPAQISIITLSFGVNDVNELTVNRLRANTRAPYDISVIVNRAHKHIIKRVETDIEIKLFIANSEASSAEQMSFALSQAKGEYIAILRDDVVIPDKWIEPLEQAMLRIPYAGILAPRVSNGSGSQVAENERFSNTAEFHLAANRRRKKFARISTIVSSISQPIFLLRREVVDRIGGFDPQFGLSELGIIDFCIRVQAAGYAIVIAEDAILHRIHPDLIENQERMLINEQDYSKAFSKKWQLDREAFTKFNVRQLIHSELAKALILVALPQPVEKLVPESAATRRAIFLLPIEGDESWQEAAKLVKKYHKAFTSDDPVSLAIGCGEAADMMSTMSRIERIVRALHIDLAVCADVIIADASNRDVWLKNLPEGPRLTLRANQEPLPYPHIQDLTPAGLRHSLEQVLQEVN